MSAASCSLADNGGPVSLPTLPAAAHAGGLNCLVSCSAGSVGTSMGRCHSPMNSRERQWAWCKSSTLLQKG